jgi:ABC-type nitrate/sulfonate/bicarbonate transport system permease component
MSLAISLFVTIPVIYSGFKGVEADQFKLARTFDASRRGS